MFVEALGWAAAALGAGVALPQVIRLIRTRTTAGISTLAWQSALGANIAWAAHGVYAGYANIWVPNLVFLVLTTMILLELRRDRRLNAFALFGPGVLLGAVTFGIDVTAGPLAFAVAAFLPSALSQVTQLHQLIVAPNIRGVSLPFLALNVINQLAWVSWSVLADEVSVTLVGSSLGTLMVINLLWALLRRARLVRARLSVISA